MLVRILFCLSLVGVLLYSYIDKQNQLTIVRLQIPTAAKKLRAILEENERMTYEIDRFESPAHLFALSEDPRFGHLRFPVLDDVITLEDGAPTEQVSVHRVGKLVAEAPLTGE